MAFKLSNPPYDTNNVPVYNVPMEDDVMGKANNNGTIVINKDIKDTKQIDDVINHEMVHIKQMKRGDLDYDDNNVYWKGKTYPRENLNEHNEKLPWEVEAYKESDKILKGVE